MAKQPTDRKTLSELGERLSRQRLGRNWTQDQLAKEAGVSKRTVLRLESGESTQMVNLVRVLRALGLLNNLDAIVPALPPSPLDALRSKSRERRRAVPPTGASKSRTKPRWTWGDERPSGDES